ncbi:MAG: HRDC domain-containing protein [Geobacter sp.]|nr:HRDC domain-containing protein [Geobacter sp.]
MPTLRYTVIEHNHQLAQLCTELANETALALDLEADSMHHYREKVCLLQLSNRCENWLIDPLQVTDLTPLGALLARTGFQTVLHGGDYDIRSLHRDFGIVVNQMFDTMVAAQFTGATEFGLAALLREHFAIELDKRFQKADWSKRPLTSEMSNYAAHDTAHLLELSDLLRARLEKLGRTAWVAEECALLVGNRVTEKGNGPLFLNCKGAGKLRPRNLAVLEALLQFRDQQARETDRPAFKVIPAEALFKIADILPVAVRDMNGIAGLTPRLLGRYGEQLLEAVQQGLGVTDAKLPRFPRGKGEPNPGIKARIARLKHWREGLSSHMELASGLLAPNWLLERIAEQQPSTLEQLETIPGIRHWQIGLWGEEMIRILAKEMQTA